jgi:hypothetical protein
LPTRKKMPWWCFSGWLLCENAVSFAIFSWYSTSRSWLTCWKWTAMMTLRFRQQYRVDGDGSWWRFLWPFFWWFWFVHSTGILRRIGTKHEISVRKSRENPLKKNLSVVVSFVVSARFNLPEGILFRNPFGFLFYVIIVCILSVRLSLQRWEFATRTIKMHRRFGSPAGPSITSRQEWWVWARTHEKKGCATDDGQTEKSFSRRLCTRHFSRTDSFCTLQIHSQTMSVPSSLRTDHANKITLLAQKLCVGAMMTSVSVHTWKERSFLSS